MIKVTYVIIFHSFMISFNYTGYL